MMRGIRGRDTGPELTVRRYLHARGFRFRLHGRELPGSPDVVLPKYRTVVFVHGCFWHRHPGCRLAYRPKSRQEFWEAKLETNVARDARDQERLRAQGWRVLVVWGCEASADRLSRLTVEIGTGQQADDEKRIKLERIARRARQAFLDGAEERSIRDHGRSLTTEEHDRVLDRYPGDWFKPPGPKAGVKR
jgi:DNA mismatch endonuclease (patch repair protein)